MGACCTNEVRDKKLDSKEARLEEWKGEEQIIEKVVKYKTESLSPSEEDTMFEQEAKKIRSPNEQVNVLLSLLQGHLQGEGNL
jgi:hypothetical protein